ncbi:MAG: hypothetical protein ABIT76_09545 [Chthoniobacterales bacterium]
MKCCAPRAFALLLAYLVPLTADDITTLAGKEYKGVRISRTEPDGIVVVTDSGIEKLQFGLLPADVQKKYGYDPAKAAKYQKAVYDAYIQRTRLENEGPYAGTNPTTQKIEASSLTTSQVEEAKTRPILNAKVLMGAYDENELNADAIVKGKVGRIRGTITDISRDLLGIPYIMLDDCVRCAFEKADTERLSSLSKGQNVIVIGQIDGKSLGIVSVRKSFIGP